MPSFEFRADLLCATVGLRTHSSVAVCEVRTVARKFSIGGLWIFAGWLDILKIDKKSTDS